MIESDLIKHQLAPKGALRAGINLSNFLLVSSKSAGGSPEGISPDIAKRVAARLGVPCEFIIFERPGKLSGALADGIWDIGNIAFEVERAQTVDFSNPYVLIEANFLVWKADDLELMMMSIVNLFVSRLQREAHMTYGLPKILIVQRLPVCRRFRQHMIYSSRKR